MFKLQVVQSGQNNSAITKEKTSNVLPLLHLKTFDHVTVPTSKSQVLVSNVQSHKPSLTAPPTLPHTVLPTRSVDDRVEYTSKRHSHKSDDMNSVDLSELSNISNASSSLNSTDAQDTYTNMVKEMYSASSRDVFFDRKLELRPSKLGGIRGAYDTFLSQGTSTSEASTISTEGKEEWNKVIARNRILSGFHDKVEGIYNGGRSSSPSPCPAPFVKPFDSSIRTSANQSFEAGFPNPCFPINDQFFKGDGSRKTVSPHHIQLLAELYTAFREADIEGTGFPNSCDIKQSFLKNEVVWGIFNLRKQTKIFEGKDEKLPQYCDDSTYKQDTTNSSEISCKTRYSGSLIPKSLFGQQKSRVVEDSWRESVLNCWNNLWTEYFLPQGCAEDRFSINDEVNSKDNRDGMMLKVCKKAQRLAQSASLRISKWREKETLEFAPSSQAKLTAMLAGLRQIETEGITQTSLRYQQNIKVRFPKYVKTFARFVGKSDWKSFNYKDGNDETNRSLFGEAIHRLLGPSVVERFVRDGYLGTNVSQYEVSLPGEITIPATLCMEGPSCSLAAKNRSGFCRKPAYIEFQDPQITSSNEKTLHKTESEKQRIAQDLKEKIEEIVVERHRLDQSLRKYYENQFVFPHEYQLPSKAVLEQKPYSFKNESEHINILTGNVPLQKTSNGFLNSNQRSKQLPFVNNNFDWKNNKLQSLNESAEQEGSPYAEMFI